MDAGGAAIGAGATQLGTEGVEGAQWRVLL